MNVESFKDRLITKTSSDFSWEVDEENSDTETVILGTEIYPNRYEHGFDLNVCFHADGVLIIDFVLGNFINDESTLKLINHFNDNVMFFKAFLRHRRRGQILIVRHVYDAASEDVALEEVTSTIDYFIDDSVGQYLEPLDVIAN